MNTPAPVAAKIPWSARWGGYWDESSRPLVSLLFVAPMLVAYEGVHFLVGPGSLRNGAEVWLQQCLNRLGFGQYLLLPVLTCGLLLAWHHLRNDAWSVRGSVLYRMILESAALGTLLLLLAQFQATLFAAGPGSESAAPLASWAAVRHKATELANYFGAGIYEELLFRLMLLPATAWLVRRAGVSPRKSLVTAIVVTSLAFSAVHYRMDVRLLGWHLHLPYGDPFQWYSFVFRTCAGLLFALLFAYRGFGVTAGTHALYDILAQSLR